jgi:hypothetical protein
MMLAARPTAHWGPEVGDGQEDHVRVIALEVLDSSDWRRVRHDDLGRGSIYLRGERFETTGQVRHVAPLVRRVTHDHDHDREAWG